MNRAVMAVDAGTGTTLGGFFHGNQIEVLTVDGGKDYLNSVVHLSHANSNPAPELSNLPESERVARDAPIVKVGEKAEKRADLENVVHGVKHIMGRSVHDPVVQAWSGTVLYSIVPDDQGMAAVNIQGRVYSPQYIMSLLIKRLKEVATAKNHGQEVSHVVAGVPAYFTHAQREATKQAFQLAGLEVVRMIDEPTAAGYAFKYECTDSTIIFILDIGQGTSDAVVMETNAEKREIQTIAKGGDNELGGDHFTNAIGEVIKKQIVFGELSSCSLAQIRNAADDIKRNICEEDPEM